MSREGQFLWGESRTAVKCPRMAPPSPLRSYAAGLTGVALVAGVLLAAACGPSAEEQRLRTTSKGSYDPQTGQLRAITYDRNKNGRIDTWVRMEGTRPISAQLDTNEDGTIDRWEEYGPAEELVRAGWIRAESLTLPDAAALELPSTAASGQLTTPPPTTAQPDSWLYPGADGRSHRIEYLDIDNGGNQVVARREFFEDAQLVRVEEDKDGDGLIDQWEVHQNGVMTSVEFDDGRDGKPDRRFTYSKGTLVLIESEPDASGTYTRRVTPGGR